MNLTMIGVGYVGLVSAACFSEFGHHVCCVDRDPAVVSRLRQGDIHIYEPGLADLVARNVSAGRLSFTDDLAQGVAWADAIFVAVGTPSRRGDGHADLKHVEAAAREIALHAREGTAIVMKSTVPVGTGARVLELLKQVAPNKTLFLASNPEFLREGSAIEDFMRPDRVVVGTQEERVRDVIRAIYRPLALREVPIVFTDLHSAELIKYASNAFLAVKISFINEMADLCEAVGASVQDVAKGMGMDGRIGGKFLHAGPGYGGSCFPKDTLALMRTAEEAGTETRIVEAAVSVNDRRKRLMVNRVAAACDGQLRGKKVAVLGVTFKPNTDDMRDAPSLVILPLLQAQGATVHACDPIGRSQAEPLLPGVDFFDDAYACAEGADVLVLITEWNEFRALDLARLKACMRSPAFVDLRNVYPADVVRDAGFRYSSIGRP